MSTETKLRAGLVMSLLVLVFLLVKYFNCVDDLVQTKHTLKLTRDTLFVKTNSYDSLHDENFNTKVELGRHELTRDSFFEKRPKLQLVYEKIYNEETE